MKTPRINDFDPSAKPPTLKSSLDTMPAIQKPPIKPPTEREGSKVQAKPSSPDRAIDRSTGRPTGRRIISRHAFEVYEDQMNTLRNLSYQEKMDGKLGSMSQMVREALDNYLNERATKK